MFDSLVTWEVLATYGGVVMMVFVFVLYTKALADKFWPKVLGTDLYSVFIGFILILLAGIFTGGAFTVGGVVLAFLNGFIIAMGAGKLHDKTIAEFQKKQVAEMLESVPETYTTEDPDKEEN